MNIESIYNICFNKVFDKYSIQGYVTSDYIFDVLEKHAITLAETEYFCNKLIKKGVLILSDKEINDYTKDYGFYDYNNLFNELIKIDNGLKFIINQIKSIKPPQKNEFEILFLQSKNGNEYARNRIIKMNMRLAVRHALFFFKKYKYPLDIAIQESFCGLIKATNTYSIEKGSFPNYAQWLIRQSLYRSLPSTNTLIECPIHLKIDLIKVTKYLKKLSTKYIYKYEKDIKTKIWKIINSPNENKINILYYCLIKPLSIEYLNENKEAIFSDEELISNLNDNITNQYLHNMILKLFSTLDRRESDILKLRYGMGITKSHTLDEIGDMYNLTRERIRQIESKAIKKINLQKQFEKLKAFIE